MNRYHAATPRPLLGIAATALSVATLAVFVVAPSMPEASVERMLVPANVANVVRIEPSRIEVIGSRATEIADERAARRPAS